MANFPEHVEVNEDSLNKLRTLYKNAYLSIYSEINGATSLGVQGRKNILAQIDVILNKLGVDVNEFVTTEIGAYYSTGATQAVTQLTDVGAPVAVKTGFNVIHQDQIKALVSDTASSFADSIQGVKRNVTQLLSKEVKQQIQQRLATGMIQGAAIRSTKQQITGILQEQGFSALVDKGGKTWQLDTYGEMLYRTKSVEARNLGLANRMLENGYDLVQVSTHSSIHPACQVWEGRVLSLTGNTPGYPTLDDAEIAGLFHPNCEHAINTVVPSLAYSTKAYNPATKQYEVGAGLADNTIPTP